VSTTQVDVQELPARFAEVISLAAAGIEVIVMEGNVPRAKLVPYGPPKPRVLGLHPGVITMADDFDAPLPEEFWLGSLEERKS